MVVDHDQVRELLSAGESSAEIAKHVRGCKACREWSATLERVRALAPESFAPPAPRGLADRVIAATRTAAVTSIAEAGPRGARRWAGPAASQPWHRRVAGRLAIAAALIAVIAASAVLVPRGGAGAVLVASAEKTEAAESARVSFDGTMKATIEVDLGVLRKMIAGLPEFPDVPDPAEPPQPPDQSEAREGFARTEAEARAEYERCRASGRGAFCEQILEGLREALEEGLRQAREGFQQARLEFREVQREFFRIARRSLSDARAQIERARAEVLASLPEKIEFDMRLKGSGVAVFPDRLHLSGEMAVSSTIPVPVGGDFELIVIGDDAWMKTPLSDGKWVAMPATQSPFALTFKPGKILEQMRKAPGRVEDLGEETLNGERVRHLRIHHGVDARANRAGGTVDLWVGAEDEILRKTQMAGEGSLAAGPARGSFSTGAKFALHDFGAEASVTAPPPGEVVEGGAEVFANGAYAMGIGDAGFSLSMHFSTSAPVPARARVPASVRAEASAGARVRVQLPSPPVVRPVRP